MQKISAKFEQAYLSWVDICSWGRLKSATFNKQLVITRKQ